MTIRKGLPQSRLEVEMSILLIGVLAHTVARAAAHHICEAGSQGEAHPGQLLGQGDSLGPCEQPGCPATARVLLSRRGSSSGPDPIKGSQASAFNISKAAQLYSIPGLAAAPN